MRGKCCSAAQATFFPPAHWSGLCELIERTCSLAKRFESGLRAAGFAVLNDVVVNQVLVSFGDGAITREVIRRIQEDGTCWCGVTEWQGGTAIEDEMSSYAAGELLNLSARVISRGVSLMRVPPAT
jgi:hypothetical protein